MVQFALDVLVLQDVRGKSFLAEKTILMIENKGIRC